jgi:crossover junction endodeoxyribonuclease RuvC
MTAIRAASAGQPIRILGIDPGLRLTGWGMIAMEGQRLSWIAHGVIAPDPAADLADRLALLADGLREVIAAHAPDEGAVEETFVNVNPKTTLLLGQARGVCLATLAASRMRVAEFAARRQDAGRLHGASFASQGG